MIKKHKNAIFVALLLLVIIIITSLNLYFLLENMNTRDERVRHNVEQILQSIDIKQSPTPVLSIPVPVKGIDYTDGKDGSNGKDGKNGIDGKDGISIKGDTGAPGKDGVDGLTIEIRCNTSKNRWEIRYVGDTIWKVMNNEAVKCTVDNEES